MSSRALPHAVLLALVLGTTACGTPPAPARSALPAAAADAVAFAPAEARTTRQAVRLLGMVQARAGAEAVVRAPAPGRAVILKRAGDRVERGTALVRLEPAVVPLGDAEERLARAEERSGDLARLAGLGLIPRVQAEAARREAERLRKASAARSEPRLLTSPFAGTLGETLVGDGALVEPGQALLRVIDPSRLELAVDLPEVLAGALERGEPARVFHAASPDLAIEAPIGHVEPTVAAGARALRVTLELPEAEGTDRPRFLPGMRAVAEIRSAPRLTLCVPREALLLRDGRLHVVVRSAGGTFLREVTTGDVDDGTVEITAGLAAGEEVAVRGSELLAPPPPATAPQPLPHAETAWLVVPAARGLGFRSRLRPPAIAAPGPLPDRVLLDARRLAAAGMTLGEALGILEAGRDLPGDLARVDHRRAFTARRWRKGGRGEPVDVVPVATAGAALLLPAARAADPDVELWGPPTAPGRSRIALAATGTLLVLLALGSVRAALLASGAAMVLAATSGSAPAALGAAAALAALSARSVLSRAAASQPLGWPSARRSAVRALRLGLPVLLVAVLVESLRRGAPALDALRLAALGIFLALLVAAALARLLAAVPSGGSFLPSVVERLGKRMTVLVALALALAARTVLPPPAGVAVVPVGAAGSLAEADLTAGLELAAVQALAAGASAVLAAPAADGSIHLALAGAGAGEIVDRLLASAPAGLGLGVAGARPAVALGGRELLHSGVAPAEAAAARALYAGALRRGPVSLGLLNPADIGLLPLGGDGAPAVFAREWWEQSRSLAAPARTVATFHAREPGLDGALLAVGALLGPALGGLLRARREGRRGASRRRLEEAAWPPTARAAAAAAGAALVAGCGLEPAALAPAVLLAWAGALLTYATAARLYSSRRNLRSSSPSTPGRALPG